MIVEAPVIYREHLYVWEIKREIKLERERWSDSEQQNRSFIPASNRWTRHLLNSDLSDELYDATIPLKALHEYVLVHGRVYVAAELAFCFFNLERKYGDKRLKSQDSFSPLARTKREIVKRCVWNVRRLLCSYRFSSPIRTFTFGQR